jgi:hypothetical protein
MKSMSDEIPTKSDLDAIATLAKSDVDQLRADLVKSHFWIYISIASTWVGLFATIALMFVHYH